MLNSSQNLYYTQRLMNLEKFWSPLVIMILINFFKEEDILDLLEQCEIDDEKLMGKTTKSRGPKVPFPLLPIKVDSSMDR